MFNIYIFPTRIENFKVKKYKERLAAKSISFTEKLWFVKFNPIIARILVSSINPTLVTFQPPE